MKKVGVLLLVSFIYLASSAQGIYQLWGTTAYGGANNMGVIFRTDASGNNFQVKRHFSSDNPGASPSSTELSEYNGKFYGVTQYGGSSGSGVIFEWDAVTNVYTTKFDFSGTNGKTPSGNLMLSGGKFYGMTQNGGSHDFGVIFEWDPVTNGYTKKIDFNGTNASHPHGSLTLKDGKFYGMSGGWIYSPGIIFEWDPVTNVFTKKIEFNGTNGRNPYGSLLLANGKFYGMTADGGNNAYGVIFEWDPAANILTKKIDFNGANGKHPSGDLTVHGGKFYGMTYQGGSNDYGVIFEWDPASAFGVKKIDFNWTNGRNPKGSLKLDGGKFYGMTWQGGGTSNSGVLFEWDPATNIHTKKMDLDGLSTGSQPIGSFTIKDGKFYGLTSGGGSGTAGVIFEWDPAINAYTKKIDFNKSDGSLPAGSLTWSGGKLYGLTRQGGAANAGTVFEWDPATNVYSRKADFNGENGRSPWGSLTMSGGKFYGMTNEGGNTTYYGVIFEWDPATNTLTKRVDLNNADGRSPFGSLTLSNGRLYGMTFYGGSSGLGAIFEYYPGSGYMVKKIDFTGSNGALPNGDLTLSGGKLYGMTTGGGSMGVGNIFEWNPVTNVFTSKFEFNGTNGSNPLGNLTMNEGKFYGIAFGGGSNNTGVIFEWDPVTNVYTKKFDFSNVNNGVSPVGNLTLSGGKFYGMTQEGGVSNKGVIFEWDPAINVYTKKLDFNGVNGNGSQNGFTQVPASVSKGLPGSCINFPAVTIDNSNNNTWVPIIDNDGNAVAEIKANGNVLGVVSVSMFVNDAAVREDNAKRLYLDRNFTITPQFQPASPVDIRLYIKSAEYLALKNAINSNGQSSGINSITDISIFKNSVNGCSPGISQEANPVVSTVTNWENDYVLSASIPSFSSFYFANKAYTALPLTLLDFNGRLLNNEVLLNWKTEDEINTLEFMVERSTDGRSYHAIGTVASANTAGIHQYSFTDANITSLNAAIVYYRLKQKDIDGRFTYSKIVALLIDDRGNLILFYPNPVTNEANLSIAINQPEHVWSRIIDNTGRVVKQQQWSLFAGSTSLSLDVKGLAKGMYYLELKGNNVINKRLKFLKK